MALKLWNLYNSFDTKSKRCIIIDLYSVLFIILPKRYFFSRLKIKLWGLLFIYLVYNVKGKEEKLIKNDNFIYVVNTKKRINMV
tara:strand:- start:232 stop:483 length:252 start_codon:yes stop_codon:yes gene_type:complete